MEEATDEPSASTPRPSEDEGEIGESPKASTSAAVRPSTSTADDDASKASTSSAGVVRKKKSPSVFSAFFVCKLMHG